MPKDPNAEPTLNDLMESDEAFATAIYDNPRAAISKVAERIEANLTAKYQQSRQTEDIAASQEANWNKFWRANPHISRADRNEVRTHLMEAIQGGDQELTNYTGDPEGAFDLMTDRAERHLKSLAKQRAEDAENSVFSGSLEEGSGEGAFEQGTSLTSIVRQRREAKRSRGRAA